MVIPLFLPSRPLFYRVKATLLKSVLLPITRPCGKAPNALRSDMRHIPKGASYFRIARPLRFQVSHSTGFLDANRRRIRLTSRVIYTNVHVNS